MEQAMSDLAAPDLMAACLSVMAPYDQAEVRAALHKDSLNRDPLTAISKSEPQRNDRMDSKFDGANDRVRHVGTFRRADRCR